MEDKDALELNRLRLTIDNINVGLWQWDITTGEEWWSSKYFEILGYKVGEIEATEEFFRTQLVHPKHLKELDDAFEAHLRGEPFRLAVQLKKKNGQYAWYLSSGQVCRYNDNNQPTFMVGSIVNIDSEISNKLELEKKELFLEETGRLAKVGGWEVDLKSMITHWSNIIYDIHEVPRGEIIPVEEGINFYHPEERPRILADFNNAINNGIPFNDTYRFITRSKKEIYVQAVGIPIYNDEGKVAFIRGIFQDIDQQKRASILMEETLAIANSQNQKLINFAHIVSHNLRNHSSNLEMLLGFIRESKDEEDRTLLLDKFDQVVSGLSETINHLNKVVQVQTTFEHDFEEVNLRTYINNALNIVSADLERLQARVNVQVDDSITFRFTPAYLESVLINMLSNAIRYRNKERTLKLDIQATLLPDENRVRIEFKDNGLGIDLAKYKERMFNMYSTFHEHPDSRGIGLFITKNQLESLQGSITVESELGIGSNFIITLPTNL